MRVRFSNFDVPKHLQEIREELGNQGITTGRKQHSSHHKGYCYMIYIPGGAEQDLLKLQKRWLTPETPIEEVGRELMPGLTAAMPWDR